jgi:hypothetical protein
MSVSAFFHFHPAGVACWSSLPLYCTHY